MSRKEIKRRWRDRHPENGREYSRRWRAEHPDYWKAWAKAYRQANPGIMAEKARRYRATHREAIKVARVLEVSIMEAREMLKALGERNGPRDTVHQRGVVEAQAEDARALVEGDRLQQAPTGRQ
jgi:hypothetical protein